MKRKYYKPYGFDMNYEFNTYRNVGKDYGTRKDANLGLLLNIRRYIRKCIKNKHQKVYKFCHTYTEWENHVKSIIPYDSANYDDMLHWLYRRRRDAECILEATKAILIPIYIALLGIKEISGLDLNIIEYLCMIVVVVIASIVALDEAKEKVDFYEDFIEIVEMKKSVKLLNSKKQ